MRKVVKTLYLICLFFLYACNNEKQNKPISSAPVSPDSQSIFPVTEFLLGQLKDIDNLPVTPLKIIIHKDRRDSIWLKKMDIRPFAEPFLHPVIDSISMQPFFTEKSFMDQTINAITLSCDPKVQLPDSIQLRHWDVYIDPEKNKVQRIYLVKEEVIGTESITTQLTWKADKWCSIRTIKEQGDKAPEVREEILKWDFDD